MPALLSWILNFAATPSGQALITWLVSLLWNHTTKEVKESLSKDLVDKAVRDAFDQFEKVLDDQREMAKDGLTEQEKDEIRKRKAAIQASIINVRP